MARRKSITGPKKKRKARSTTKAAKIEGRASSSSPSTNYAVDTSAVHVGAGTKRTRAVNEDDHNLSDEEPQQKRATLKPRVRYIHQDIIKTKWQVLPEQVQDRIQELFTVVQRPVIARVRDDRQRIEVQAALSSITRTLGKRLPRIPFPPKTKEEHFNYEVLLNKNRTLEEQLTPTLHHIALLEGQLGKEEILLASERTALKELQRNAKAAETLLQQLEVLLADSEVKSEIEDNADSIGLAIDFSGGSASLNITMDASLEPLIAQLENHLDSMESNASQVVGLHDALSDTSTVLEKVILDASKKT
ncbi:hypothetical protein MMC19_002134 [Ptychographa xylographoides]|nr:hypothetical protein [Ptychographa xylographoides]